MQVEYILQIIEHHVQLILNVTSCNKLLAHVCYSINPKLLLREDKVSNAVQGHSLKCL